MTVNTKNGKIATPLSRVEVKTPGPSVLSSLKVTLLRVPLFSIVFVTLFLFVEANVLLSLTHSLTDN